MRITEMAESRTFDLQTEVKQKSILDRLPRRVRQYAISFLVGNKAGKFNCNFIFQKEPCFFVDLNISYAIEATHNLLNRIRVNETLECIKRNPEILSVQVQVKDIHGLKYRGKPLQVLASAHEFDPIEMKADAKPPHGLVPLLCSWKLKNFDFKNQLQKRFGPGHEAETND